MMRYMESDRRTFPLRGKHFALLAVLIIVVAAGGGALGKSTIGKSSTTLSKQTNMATNPSQIRLIATGDWLAHGSVNAAAKQAGGTYNYLPLVSDFKPVFSQADVRYCTLPILNGGESLGISGYPYFNAPTEFANDMGRLGCNLVDDASNHSFDFTQANITASVDAWDKVPNMLAVVGENRTIAEHEAVNYFTAKGVKFAFFADIAYSNVGAPPLNDCGVNLYSRDFAARQITEAKSHGAQMIIVGMRWGVEYSTTVSTEQKQEAQFLTDQ